MTSPTGSVRRRWMEVLWILFPLLGGLPFSTLLLLSVVCGAGFLDPANEPLAHRFFYSQRVFSGETRRCWLLSSLLHHAVYCPGQYLAVAEGSRRMVYE